MPAGPGETYTFPKLWFHCLRTSPSASWPRCFAAQGLSLLKYPSPRGSPAQGLCNSHFSLKNPSILSEGFSVSGDGNLSVLREKINWHGLQVPLPTHCCWMQCAQRCHKGHLQSECQISLCLGRNKTERWLHHYSGISGLFGLKDRSLLQVVPYKTHCFLL